MFSLKQRSIRLVASLIVTPVLAIGMAIPAFADNSVSLNVSGGTRTASIANVTLTGLTYSHSDQSRTGTMNLSVDDSTGTGAGWNVTVQSSDFAYTGGSANGVAIPAANFSIATANAPAKTAGQDIDATNGPKVPDSGATGTLDSAHKVIQAVAGYGLGSYTQALDVNLDVPAQSRSGDYNATLTVTISAAP
jgi:hypothetical protein